jgi:hypothetical protein
MALFSIVLSFRNHQPIFQVRAQSPTEAIRVWASSLEKGAVANFGNLSKDRLVKSLEFWGVNAVEGCPGVWDWATIISGYATRVVLIATDERV